MSYRTVADDVRPDWRHAAPHDACLRSPITSQVHRRRRFPKNGVFAFCSRHADPVAPKYRYVYSGDRVMLVDPGSRTVVQEVD